MGGYIKIGMSIFEQANVKKNNVISYAKSECSGTTRQNLRCLHTCSIERDADLKKYRISSPTRLLRIWNLITSLKIPYRTIISCEDLFRGGNHSTSSYIVLLQVKVTASVTALNQLSPPGGPDYVITDRGPLESSYIEGKHGIPCRLPEYTNPYKSLCNNMTKICPTGAGMYCQNSGGYTCISKLKFL